MNTRHPLGRIFVVDDEVQVNELLRDFLSGLGYIVKNAVSGREALCSTACAPTVPRHASSC